MIPAPLSSGSTLGRYELLLPIAKGGMAQVWAARLRGTRGFQKLVAVKTILPGTIDNTRMEQMFLEEAQIASQIHHPNVVGTTDLGEHEGTLYLVMEWVDGEPLSQVLTKALEQGGLPIEIAVNLIGQACQGLHAAHELRDDNGNPLGVVHRDVSPQNLLVTFSGVAKLVDFGIAKATSRAQAGLTEAGEIKGKFSYMSPEQVQGQPFDRRTDLFALGIIAYLLTTGRHPFRGEHPAETVRNIVSEKPPVAPSVMIANYPPTLEYVIMKALEKSPDRRWDTANDMLSALEAAMPEALEGSFQQDVAAHLKMLFGSRPSERRAAIRQAQETADRQRSESSVGSVGTLRAISLDSIPDSSAPLSGSSGLRQAPGGTVGSTLISSRPAAKRTKLAAIALVGASLASLSVHFFSGSGSGVDKGTAASPVPADPRAFSTLPAAGTLPATSAPVQPKAVEAAPTAEDASDEEGPTPKKPRGTRAATAKQASAPLVTSTTSPTPAAAAPAAAQAPAAPAKATPSANAWDRETFGGRH